MAILTVTCPCCKKDYIYTNIKDMESFLHWGDTHEHKKIIGLDGQSYMFCNDCYKKYKTFENQTNTDIKEKFKNFMNATPSNAQQLNTMK